MNKITSTIKIIETKDLNKQQHAIVKSNNRGYHVVYGAPGTGKTSTMLHLCINSEKNESKPALILCFTIAQKNYLRQIIDHKKLTKAVKVFYFHEWCESQLLSANTGFLFSTGLRGVADEWHLNKNCTKALVLATQNRNIEKNQYSSIYVDQADGFFKSEWIKLLQYMTDINHNSIWLFFNSINKQQTQNLKQRLLHAKITIESETVLSQNYRNSRSLLHFCYKFLTRSLTSYKIDSELFIKPQALTKTGVKPKIVKSSNILEEVQYISQFMHDQISNHNKNWRDIAILYSNPSSGKKISQVLKSQRLPHHWLASDLYCSTYKPTSNKITLSPLSNAKGLEFDTVILLDSSYICQKDLSVIERQIFDLYLGIMCAQQYLLITYHHSSNISNILEALSDSSILESPYRYQSTKDDTLQLAN